MDNKEILEQYAKGLASSGKTRTLYLRFAGDFLDYADGDFSRENIDKYLEHIRRKKKYSDGSVNFAFRVVRTMFGRSEKSLKEEGFEWPYRRGESPIIREDKIQAPALHPNTIARLIQTVKEDSRPEIAAFLALSTTYGLRRVEMAGLTNADIRLKDKSIHIATAKHGRERTHLIPEEIIPYLKKYDFDKEVSNFGLFTLWYQLEHTIGLPHTNQVGWHSIRRCLNTLLLRKLPEVSVMSFLRWKQRTSSHMPFRYSAITFVGEEGESTEAVGEALAVDSEMFHSRPCLEDWK